VDSFKERHSECSIEKRRIMNIQSATARKRIVGHFEDLPIAKALFGHVRWAWIWLILRLYAGWVWVQAGWGKLHNPAWTDAKAGTALSSFVNHALTETSGAHPNVEGWYAWFLRHAVLANPKAWSYVISWGEFLVGIALILGIFTGLAAFFGAFMNVGYLLAGAVSTNPILLVIAVLLILAWKTAGWWGLDRWLLPALGTPWRPEAVFHLEGEECVRPMAEHPGRA
jgi:thiosulfate dehydrogenase [quinone] large subunit